MQRERCVSRISASSVIPVKEEEEEGGEEEEEEEEGEICV